MELTSDSAKQFLLSKLDEQASHDRVSLDETERRMFLFSELAGGLDFEANEKFEKDYDSDEYESKVAKLLARSYERDKTTEGGRASWKAALEALGKEDFYGLVMVDQAKIPRVTEALRVNVNLWVFLLEMLPLVLVEGGLLCAGSILIFQPSKLGLHPPDWFRLLLLPLFFWLFWYVGKVFSRRQSAKSTQREESHLV
jgi:hypothetical protein